MIAAIRHGRSAMPAIPRLRDEGKARQLVPFVRILTPGFRTYSSYCAPCHGDDGRGGGVLASGENAPTVVFDQRWAAALSEEDLRRRVAHMLNEHRPVMPHFRGRLSDEELRAVVRHLKQTN
jgi:mono/diheme cytochrome c family protein